MTLLTTRPFQYTSVAPARRMLSDLFTPMEPIGRIPALEVTRTENAFRLEIPVAGFQAADVEATLHENTLSIVAKNDRHRFEQSIALPENTDYDNIVLDVEHGMLTVTLPISAKSQPKRLVIGRRQE